MKSKFLPSLLAPAVLWCTPLRAAFSPSPPLFTRLNGPVSVRAEFGDHALFVAVTINGNGPFRMMVDTGSSVTVLTPACAAAAGVRLDDEQPSAIARNGFENDIDVPMVVLHTLELGSARFEGVSAGVSADLLKTERTLGQRFDGVLGFSLFSDVFVALDFSGQRLLLDTVWPQKLPPIQAELDLRIVREVPRVTARIQGRDLELTVDTGSNSGVLIQPEFAERTSWKAEPRVGPLVGVIGETEREYVGRLAGEIHFGRVTQIEPVVGITSGAASVGVEFLRHFCVVIDQAHDKLWLCASSDEAVPAPPTRSVGLSLLADKGGWRVAGTIPGSPAEGAGIAAGDMVTQIEGRPATTWSRDQIEGWTDQHSRIALHVVRNQNGRDLALPVWSLVP